METTKFVIGGRTGDLLHCLYSVRGICEKLGTKADLYITDDISYGGDGFHFDINRTFEDLKPLILKQDYISSFNILKDKIDNFINLNDWRKSSGVFKTNWIKILSESYQIPVSGKNWISYDKDELKEGERVEKEHVKNTKVGKKIAKRISQTHLDEDPGYYRKLKKVEKSDG
jgi:hypothetical protein